MELILTKNYVLYIYIVSLISIPIASHAQGNIANDYNIQNQNINIYISDTNVIDLINKKNQIDKNTPLEGYRIQIFSGTSRITVYNLQAKFALLYPNISSYITYDGSNYKLRVGDFIFYRDAESFKKEIYNKYNIALIVKDTINSKQDSTSADAVNKDIYNYDSTTNEQH